MKSTKTTAAGVLGGLGMLGSVLATVLSAGGGGLAALFTPGPLGQLVAGVGAILLGLFARDDDVTSEGTRAPKKG
jgi:hypothetical protein